MILQLEEDLTARPMRLGIRSFSRCPVTTILALASLLACGAVWQLNWNEDPLLMNSRIWQGELWRPITCIILHGNLLHLGFNLYWLWIFGTMLEPRLGSRLLLGISVVLAFGSSIAQYTISGPGIGLSGVLYGYFAIVWVLSRTDHRFRGCMSQATINLFLVWLVLCWIMTQADIWKIGNVAHASGAVFGALIGFGVSSGHRWRIPSWLGLTTLIVALVLVGWTRPPHPNELAMVAFRELEKGNHELAVENYQEALDRRPDEPDWWGNLGFAQMKRGKHEESLKAYEKATQLRPDDANFKVGLLHAKFMVAYNEQLAGRLQRAISIYQDIVKTDPRHAGAWFNLGLALAATGNPEEGLEAIRKAVAIEPQNKEFRAVLNDGLNRK